MIPSHISQIGKIMILASPSVGEGCGPAGVLTHPWQDSNLAYQFWKGACFFPYYSSNGLTAPPFQSLAHTPVGGERAWSQTDRD